LEQRHTTVDEAGKQSPLLGMPANPYRPRKGRGIVSMALLAVAAFALGLFVSNRFGYTGGEVGGAVVRSLRATAGAAAGATTATEGQLALLRTQLLTAQAKVATANRKAAKATAQAARAEAATKLLAEKGAAVAAGPPGATRAGVGGGGGGGGGGGTPAAPPLVSYDYGNGAAPRPWPVGMSQERWEGHARGEGMLYILTGCCSRFCDWQAVVGVHAAAQKMLPDQSIIRFAACDVASGRSIGPSADFGRTEVFSHGSDNLPSAGGGKFYPPLSKSRSLARWVQGEEAAALPDKLNIALIDEDFLMLEPLRPSATPGHPVAQDWNDAFHGSKWLGTPIKDHCRGHCEGMTHAQARAHEAGPPYTMTLGDLRRVAPLWHELTVDILNTPASRKAAEWLVDMYSYVLASIILGLRHTLRTDWQTTFVETFHEVNGPFGFARMADRGVHEHQSPAFLHYCQPYRQTDSKGRTLTISKHALHERGDSGPGLLSCSADVSDERLLTSLLENGQGSFETSVLDLGKGAAARSQLLAELQKMTEDSAPTYQKALQETIAADGAAAADLRKAWIFATLYKGMRAAFAEFRQRMCKEPMDGF